MAIQNDWIAKTQIEAARVLGVSRATLQSWRADGCPGHRGWFPIIEIIAWARENRWDAPPVEEAELMAGGPSPALERWREARADSAELDLGLKRGDVCELDDVREVLRLTAECVRTAARRLEIQFGPDASAIFNDCHEQMGRALEQRFPGSMEPIAGEAEA